MQAARSDGELAYVTAAQDNSKARGESCLDSKPGLDGYHMPAEWEAHERCANSETPVLALCTGEVCLAAMIRAAFTK